MKEYLLMLIIMLFLPGCEKENKANTEIYPLAKIDKFKQDDSLYTGEKLITYPTSIKETNETYSKKDLDNLDYDKEVKLNDIFFRIPSKCEIFKKEDSYFIDFPLDSSYNILISFKKLDATYDLIDLSNVLIKEENLAAKIISQPVRNKFTDLDSAYFISRDDEYTYTHFFIKSANSTLYFTIKENGTRAGGKIMSDILMTSYVTGNDPFEVRKTFEDFKDSLSIFATSDVDFADLSLKIPENFLLKQEGDGFKYFLAKEDNEVLGEIIMKEDRLDGSLYDAYSLNSGDIIYPTQLINMGEVSLNNGILEGEIRLYSRENTLTGKKFVLKKKNYLTIIVVGPLANKSLAISMAESIKESIIK